MGCGSSIETASGDRVRRASYPPQASTSGLAASPKNSPTQLMHQPQRVSDSTTERSKSSLRSGSLPRLEQSPSRLGGSLNAYTGSPTNLSGEFNPLPSHPLSPSREHQQEQEEQGRQQQQPAQRSGWERSNSMSSQLLLSPKRSRSGSLALQLYLPGGTTQRHSGGLVTEELCTAADAPLPVPIHRGSDELAPIQSQTRANTESSNLAQEAITTTIPTMRASPSTHLTSTGGQEDLSDMGSGSFALETTSQHSYGIPAAEPASPLWWQTETFMSSTNRVVSIPLQLERERRRLATANGRSTGLTTQGEGMSSLPPALDSVSSQHQQQVQAQMLTYTSPTVATAGWQSDSFPCQDPQSHGIGQLNSPPSQPLGLVSPTGEGTGTGILGASSSLNSPPRAANSLWIPPPKLVPGPSFLPTGRKKMVQSWLEDTTPLQPSNWTNQV
jgi:hypothetical protein